MPTEAQVPLGAGGDEQRQRTLGRERALSDMTRAVAAVMTDTGAVLDAIARCAAEQVGDACAVWLVGEDGRRVDRGALAHADDPSWVEAARALPLQREGAEFAARIVQTAQAWFLPEVAPEVALGEAPPECQDFLRRWPLHGMVGVPLRADGEIVGTAHLLRTAPGRPYTRDDLAFLQEVADRSVTAIMNGRLREALRRAQEATEQIVRARTEELALANEALQVEIAERRAAEAQVREHERFLDSIIENLPDMVFVKDAEALRFVRFNRAGEELLGFARQDLIGKNDYDFFPKAEADFFTGKDREVLAGKVVVDIPSEPIHTKVKGQRTLHTKKIPVLDPEGRPRYLLGISRDITEQEQLRAALARSERLASIGLLSAGIAHEINNPTAYVANNLHVLARDVRALMAILDVYEGARDALATAAPEAAARAAALAEEADLGYVRANLERVLERTCEGVARVTRIVESLRSLVRSDRVVLVETDLRVLAGDVLEMLRGQLERRSIAVEVEADGAPTVRCVPTMLSQVLLNLLTNAMHAVEAAHPAGGGRILVRGLTAGDEHVLEVSDNGVGIPAESLARLFDPFFTTKPVGEGTGLGLAIIHGLVANHGGRIEVESRVGEGARFRVHLPRGPHGGSA